MIIPLALSAILLLDDSLPKATSAALALAAERAQMQPRYRKTVLGLDFGGVTPNRHFYTWIVVPDFGEGVNYFAVDRRTGDVWAYLGCERLRSPEIKALQTHFRRRFHIPPSAVRQIEITGSPTTGCGPN
jgi:hypothetical protein